MATRPPPQDRALYLEPVPAGDCARCWGNDWQIGAFRWWCGECGMDEGEAPPALAENAPSVDQEAMTTEKRISDKATGKTAEIGI